MLRTVVPFRRRAGGVLSAGALARRACASPRVINLRARILTPPGWWCANDGVATMGRAACGGARFHKKIKFVFMLNYCFRKIALSFSIIALMFSCYFLFIQSNYIVYFNVKNGESHVYDCRGYFCSKYKMMPPDDDQKIFYETYGDELPVCFIRCESSDNLFSRNGFKIVPFVTGEFEEYASTSGEFLKENDWASALKWFEEYRDLTKYYLNDLSKRDYRQSSGAIVLESDDEMNSVLFSLFLRNYPDDLFICAILVVSCVLFVVSPVIVIICVVKKVFATVHKKQ